jgi:hypothetical protein
MSFLFRSESPADLAALDALLDRELERARELELAQEPRSADDRELLEA